MRGFEAQKRQSRRSILGVCFVVVGSALASAQDLPQAPGAPWIPPRNLRLPRPAEPPPLQLPGEAEPLSLAVLIDLAETRSPQTQAAWQQAKQAAAEKDVAKSALYPIVKGLILSRTLNEETIFGPVFVAQNLSLVDPTLQFDYLVFDDNARLDALRAARGRLYAADYAFNTVHLALMRQVADSYYALLNNEGLVEAAKVNLKNAQAVAEQEDARLANGLATLPDALETRAAAAQARYELVSLQGARTNAQADLATTLRLPAQTVLSVIPLDRLATPSALNEAAVETIARALAERPDLLEHEALAAAAAQAVKQARAAFYPRLSLTGQFGFVRITGSQQTTTSPQVYQPTAYASLDRYNAQFNLDWTLFDGGRRRSELNNAKAGQVLATDRLNEDRDRIEKQVWTAYTNLQTAFAQQQAAVALLTAAASSYSAATDALASGVRTVVDVVTAQRTLAQARSQDVTARTNLFVQATELAFQTGQLLSSHTGPATLPPPKQVQP